MSSIDCKHSLFSSEIGGEEGNEESKTIVTANVTCELRVAKMRAASFLARAACGFAYYARTPTSHRSRFLRSSLRSSPRIFEQKRDCLQSRSSSKKFACNIGEQLFHYRLDCDEPFQMEGWRMVKSETCRDAETVV